MAQNAAQKLRTLLGGPDILVAPVVSDPLTARLAHEAGFPLGLLGGFGIAAIGFGMPDAGLIDFTEVVTAVHNTCAANPGFPIIADGDTGYGNALNVQRTVIEYARAGVAAVMIEDQVSPKKCGHTRGKQVISRNEARMKIRAAVDAARDTEILILARTDARAVHGFDEALNRCRDFEAEGADIIFLEAPETEDEMRRFCGAMTKPCMANMVPGGKTPILPPKGLQDAGYKLGLYPVALMTSAIAAMQSTLAALRQPDAGNNLPPSIPFLELQKIVGFPDYWDREARYKTND